jgi:DNA replication and repair protein RecF
VRLLDLVTRSFRNLDAVSVEVDAPFVVIQGENGHGKTNFLEAIWLLATLRPLRGSRLGELAAFGTAEGAVAGAVRTGDVSRRHRVDVGSAGRKTTIDSAPTSDLATWFERIRAVSFVPDDARIVTGEPSLRRAWIDRAAFTLRPSHLDVARTYGRVVDQKAAALRQEAPVAVLDALDAQLATWGARLAERRTEALAALVAPVAEMHDHISGAPGTVAMRLRTEADGDDVAGREAALVGQLRARRPEERRRRRTLVGPHLDDVVLELDGRSPRTFGSQGQVRSLVLSMKLGELRAASQLGEAPLFLLDDVSSELDRHRTRRLVEVLAGLGAQVFATTTDAAHLGALPDGHRVLRVVRGAIGPA